MTEEVKHNKQHHYVVSVDKSKTPLIPGILGHFCSTMVREDTIESTVVRGLSPEKAPQKVMVPKCFRFLFCAITIASSAFGKHFSNPVKGHSSFIN